MTNPTTTDNAAKAAKPTSGRRNGTGKAKPRTTKKAQLIRMLSAKSGADVETISGKLGWQSHTTRAAITGLKKAGYGVNAEKVSGRPTRYRIISEAQGSSAKVEPQTAPKAEASPETANAG